MYKRQDDHRLTVIASDGADTEPFEVDCVNIAVAERVLAEYPGGAVLRKHPAPSERMLEPLVRACAASGLAIRAGTSRELGASLDACERPGDPYFNTAVRILGTRCMAQAVYFSSAECGREEYRHYGLAAPLYTHFTSPIRRYADVLVHRLLAAALGLAPLPAALLDARQLPALCRDLNYRHKHAQHAGNIKYFSRDVQKRIKEGSITKDELLAFLPDFKRGSLGTCAVVGSAANVLKAKMGTEIDAHDTVLRFAGPHPAQYKRALGTKATGVFEKRSYSRRFKLISPEKYFFFSGRRSSGPPGENFHKKGKQVVQYGSQIGGWRNEAQGMWKEMTGSRRKAPSGGVARIIALANLSRMGACTRLDLYGFGARQQGQFFNTKKMVNRAHVPALEHRLRSYLMASGVMGKLCVYGD